MMEWRRRGRTWQGWVVGAGMGVGLLVGLGASAMNVESAQASTEPAFVLSGVVIDGRGASRALLEEPQLTGGHPIMLRVGDMIGSYRVASIAEDHTVLQGPGGSVIRVPLGGIPGAPTITNAPVGPAAASTVASAPASNQVTAQQTTPPLSEEELARLSAPPGPGEPRYRPASEGASTPGPRPPAFDVEDFKRQIQQHLTGGSPR